jgi:hypothetical protein
VSIRRNKIKEDNRLSRIFHLSIALLEVFKTAILIHRNNGYAGNTEGPPGESASSSSGVEWFPPGLNTFSCTATSWTTISSVRKRFMASTTDWFDLNRNIPGDGIDEEESENGDDFRTTAL